MLNVDQPRSGATIRRLLERHLALGRSITIPEYAGKGGHPIIVDARLLGELLEIDEETLGVKSVVRRHANDVARVDLGDAEVLWDLNTRSSTGRLWTHRFSKAVFRFPRLSA